jgi:rare lipoprotein A (peptidoglycan hydrolase)
MIKYSQFTVIIIVITLLCGCGSQTPIVKRDSAGQYTINGKTYYPMKTVAAGYSQKGVASWYGPGFHGKKTSSGEVYDMHCMTAAHSVLPLNTMVKVTNLANNKEVVVRVNDRGPFVNDRVIDLSLAAARDLGMVQSGTVPVRVSVIGAADSRIASKIASSPTKSLPSRFPNPFYSAKDQGILAKL